MKIDLSSSSMNQEQILELYAKLYKEGKGDKGELGPGIPHPSVLKEVVESLDLFEPMPDDYEGYAIVPLESFPKKAINKLVCTFFLGEESPFPARIITEDELMQELKEVKQLTFEPIEYGAKLAIGQLLEWFASLRPETLEQEDLDFFNEILTRLKPVCQQIIIQNDEFKSLVKSLDYALPQHDFLASVREHILEILQEAKKEQNP